MTNKKLGEIFDFTSTSDACIKCGKCKTNCTIFNINQDEATSPRGFIDLLGAYKKGELELDLEVKNIFESCFLCTQCVDVCPSSLPTDTLIENIRADIAQKYGISWFKRLFFYLLRHRKIMDFVAKMGWVFQSCAMKIQPQKQRQISRFSLPMIKKGRALPFAKSKSFLNSYPQEISLNSSRKVAIFIGCMSNYAYTSTGDSLVNILKVLKYDILIPKKQLCCGAPAYFTGDFDTVFYLIKNNIIYFEEWIDEVEAIIIPEATCSAMITHDWVVFLENQKEFQWAKRAKKIINKTHLATKWLYDNSNLNQLLSQSPKQNDLVTYHDPCHAKLVQGVYKEPRELLLNNYQIKEMEQSDRCCGFGGVSIQSQKYHLAQKAGEPKAKMIQQTKASVVSAECSACRLQINDSMVNNGVDEVVFKNPIELIWEALSANRSLLD
jgi:glycolate oxidase iron-sulfur subunit